MLKEQAVTEWHVDALRAIRAGIRRETDNWWVTKDGRRNVWHARVDQLVQLGYARVRRAQQGRWTSVGLTEAGEALLERRST